MEIIRLSGKKKTSSWSGARRAFPSSVRAKILKRDPVCVACGLRKSVVADHIVNHAKAKRLGWSVADIDHVSNGQGMCRPCHDVKTKAEQREGIASAPPRASKYRKPTGKHPGLR